jgi:hypothetical protein
MKNINNDFLQKNENFQNEIFKIMKKHPIFSLEILAFIGGLFYAGYFMKTGILPIFKIDEFIFTLLVSSFFGLGTIMISIVALAYPILIHDIKEFGNFYKSINENDKMLKMKLIVLPLFLFIILSILWIYLHKYFSFNIFVSCAFYGLNILFMTFIIFNFYMRKINVHYDYKRFFKYFGSLCLSYLSLFFSFIIAYAILSNSEELKNNESLFISFLVLFMMSFIVINTFKINLLKRVFLNIFVYVTFLFVTKTYYVVPFFIVKTFNIGQVNIQTLYLYNEECKVIGLKSENGEGCTIENVNLIWNIGNTLIIEKKNENNEIKRYNFSNNQNHPWSQTINK